MLLSDKWMMHVLLGQMSRQMVPPWVIMQGLLGRHQCICSILRLFKILTSSARACTNSLHQCQGSVYKARWPLSNGSCSSAGSGHHNMQRMIMA